VIEIEEKDTMSFEEARTFARRLAQLAGLDYEGEIETQTIDGFTEAQIANMISNPAQYSSQLISLSNYMYRNYGYYQRLANYLIDMALCNWTVDTEVFDDIFYSVDPDELRKNFIAFCGQISKYNLQSEMPRIMKRVILEDACFGYLVPGSSDYFVYYLPASRCSIRTISDGIYGYGINASSYSASALARLPKDIQSLINKAKSAGETWALVPQENSLCIKYNDHVTYLYPPLFGLSSAVLDILDYKSLAKQKAENDNYNVISLGIPTDNDKDDHLRLTDNVAVPFAQMARNILPANFGVIPHPFKMEAFQFKSNTSDRDNVDDAISHFYDEAGVPQSLLASSSSGSELKMSIENDASDIYRLYRQLEQSINLKMKIAGFVYSSHRFLFKIMDTTVYNIADRTDQELKKCEASMPNKMRLCAVQGVNPASMLGNDHLENAVLNIGITWTVLKSSHTTSSSGDEGGRPQSDETDLTPAGEQTRENGGNDADNRV